MKFTLHRKPDSKAQKIPFPAMQIAGLADAEALVLRAEEGCILLARDSLSTREIVKVIAFLDEIVTSMACLLYTSYPTWLHGDPGLH